MEVCLSGSVFSSLVYELENSEGDVEGLLLGQISSRIRNTITDSQSENLTHERVATIQGFVPFGKVHSFYTAVGHLVGESLSEELNNDNEKAEKVIGWFKFRRNTQGLVSMRERLIHHNLIEKFNFTPAKEFILAVFTAHMSRDMSTHKFDYSFCRSTHRAGHFEPVQVQILNLGDTSHSEYRLNCHSAQATSSLFHEVIDTYRNDFVDNQGCLKQSSHMHGMYITMMKKLQELADIVKKSETTVSSLTEEVESRRVQLEECRLQLANKNAPCEVDEKRPLQPNSVTNEASHETEEDCKTVNQSGSEMPVKVNTNTDATVFTDNNQMETNDQDIPVKENEDVSMEGKPSTNLLRTSRRKQKTPAKVAHYIKTENDDDITDDETQTYSIDDNITRENGPDYEDKFSKSLAMETSSPVF
ncbi:hypothetical protein ACROYT_G006169 [Oculina patagonica]